MLGHTFKFIDEDTPVSEASERLYALIAAYAADGHVPAPDPEFFEGDAHAIVFTYDVMCRAEERPWEACDGSVVRAACEEHGVEHEAVARAVLAFRRWLRDTGRAGDSGITSIEALVLELAASPPGPFASLDRPNRAERRLRARIDRRLRRG